MNSKQIEQIVNKTLKKMIANQGINLSTRKGNKELGLLIKKIAKHSFNSQQEVTTYAEKIGAAIINLPQQKGKTNLDQGVIRQIFYLSEEVTQLSATKLAEKTQETVSSKSEVIVSPTPLTTQSATSPLPIENV